MQAEQVIINTKANEVAQSSFEVSKNRFYIGKITVTDLNLALKEKDGAKRTQLASLYQYWSYYYNIRRLTLFDFQQQQTLIESLDKLIKK
jgi:outer membrane protein TolC